MNRRHLLAASALAWVAPYGAVLAGEGGVVDFSQAAYEQALANGEPLLLDFYAGW